MKKIILSIGLLFFMIPSWAQLGIGYKFGYSSYKMSEMNTFLTDMQRDMKKQYPIPLMITDNFPSYYSHYVEVTYALNKNEFGLNFTSLSTAGRITYSDYSGEFAYNLNMDAYRIGLVYRNHFSTINKVSFFADVSPTLTFNNITSDGYIETKQIRTEIDKKYQVGSEKIGISISPFIGTQWNTSKNLGINIAVGYNVEIAGKLENSEETKIDWSGFRSAIGVTYKLPF